MPPDFLLSGLLGGLYGTIFHLWRGKTVRDLFIYFLTGIVGFLFGQGVGNILGFEILTMGRLHLLEATLVSWLLLLLIYWLKL
jgi:hypothetical protein